MSTRVALAAGSYAVTFLAGLIGMFWNQLQDPPKDDRPGTMMMFVVGIVAAAVARAVAGESVRRAVLGIGAAMAGGVLLDAIIHFVLPPETGSLWPLGVFAVFVIGCIAGLAGVAIADIGALVGSRRRGK